MKNTGNGKIAISADAFLSADRRILFADAVKRNEAQPAMANVADYEDDLGTSAEKPLPAGICIAIILTLSAALWAIIAGLIWAVLS